MNIGLWICQGLLALIFLISGSAKISMSKERMLKTGQTGVAPFPLPVVRFTAACELLAVIGLLVPRATSVLPGLTGVAAIGLGIVMIGAMVSHASLREYGTVGANALIFGTCCFVAVGTL
jgi:uncharacterized membrane protein YphA (DoxX/SURF4 family)